MDILNWLYLRKERLIKKTANNANTDLVAIGADVSFLKRDDKYKTYAMPIKDLSLAGDVANTGYYTVDLNTTSTVNVTTPKGVIEITMDFTNAIDPAANFATSVGLTINNPDMDFSDLDKVYYQATPYYNPDQLGDTFIPYVLAVGALPGLNLEIFNASSVEIGGVASLALGTSTTILAEANKIYTYLPTTTTGPGSGAVVTLERDGAGAISNIIVANTGREYVVSDTLDIPGNYVGGASPADDVTLNVAAVDNENIFTGKFYLYYELYNF